MEYSTSIALWIALSLASGLWAYVLVRPRKSKPACFFFALPLVPVFLAVPWALFDRDSQIIGLSITGVVMGWLANFKLLMLCCDRGALSEPSLSSNFPRFLALLFLPIHATHRKHGLGPGPRRPDGPAVPGNAEVASGSGRSGDGHESWHKLLLQGALKVAFMSITVPFVDDGWATLPRPVYTALIFLNLYMYASVVMELCAAAASAVLGVQVLPHFNQPYLATSLSQFWARRWNLTVSALLRESVYEPILELITGPSGSHTGLTKLSSASKRRVPGMVESNGWAKAGKEESAESRAISEGPALQEERGLDSSLNSTPPDIGGLSAKDGMGRGVEADLESEGKVGRARGPRIADVHSLGHGGKDEGEVGLGQKKMVAGREMEWQCIGDRCELVPADNDVLEGHVTGREKKVGTGWGSGPSVRYRHGRDGLVMNGGGAVDLGGLESSQPTDGQGDRLQPGDHLKKELRSMDHRKVGVGVVEAVAVLATFLVSGVMHELCVFYVAGQPTGEMVAFFGIHGVGVVLERWLVRAKPQVRSTPLVVCNLVVLAFCLWTADGLFLPPMARANAEKTWIKELRHLPDPIWRAVLSSL